MLEKSMKPQRKAIKWKLTVYAGRSRLPWCNLDPREVAIKERGIIVIELSEYYLTRRDANIKVKLKRYV